MISTQLYVYIRDILDCDIAHLIYNNKASSECILLFRKSLEYNLNQLPIELQKECLNLFNGLDNDDLFISEATRMNKTLINNNCIENYNYINNLTGVISDTHITKCCNLDIIYNSYKFCESKGIINMLHLGDLLNKLLDENIKVFEDFMKIIENDFKNIYTHFLYGNHDRGMSNRFNDNKFNNLKVYNFNSVFKQGLGDKNIILTHTSDKKLKSKVTSNKNIIYLNGHTHTPEAKLVAHTESSIGISFPACNASHVAKYNKEQALFSLLSFSIINKALSQFTVYEINANENSEKLKNKALMKTYKF